MSKWALTAKDLIKLLYQEGSLPDYRIRGIRLVEAPKGVQNISPVEIDVYAEGEINTYQGTLKINHQQGQAVLTWWDGGKIVITFPLEHLERSPRL